MRFVNQYYYCIVQVSDSNLGVPAGRGGQAIRSYCTGLNHRPVSAPILNAKRV
ncbi:MAG: hypothetical protein ABIN91_09145 [Mucilaginibacter sp.]|uniref:hypothetical protein n=1 Tax=Mucilaginibacter sp. TaxID=1882438 RepID=UPI0032645D4C